MIQLNEIRLTAMINGRRGNFQSESIRTKLFTDNSSRRGLIKRRIHLTMFIIRFVKEVNDPGINIIDDRLKKR